MNHCLHVGMNKERIQQVLAGAAGKKVVVVGDVMLDRFIYGKVSRISPEAPVPVVEVLRESSYPGGAANVARNLQPFCQAVHICGLTGEDGHALELRQLIESEGVEAGLLVRSAAFGTTVKTRIIARQQQVVRVDRERRQPPPPEVLQAALERLESVADEVDAVILEDYGKGFLSQEMVDAVAGLFRQRGKILTVDPNPGNPLSWHGMTAIKPNRLEAFAAAGEPLSEPVDNPLQDAPLLRVGARLLELWQSNCLLITLGEDGMILFEGGQEPFHIPTKAREVFDVSGAGDTAIALFTAALAAGTTAREAAEISNFASGVVVGKLGTATLTPQELLDSVEE
jgi:rfaE bifunctional protein kinase chain/domain